ncbi:MAG: protein-glutamate O-methyltransferase CheR [Verrucomicrobiae bacterium]|nr:protein-glutamate O-methyltransferase CheR [Verrucomicrobiae bacterium]
MPTRAENVSDYDFIIDLVYERSRIRLHDGKHALIRARLGKRMRWHGCDTFAEYCDLLRCRADENEIQQVVDALATNFTGFQREPDHFDFLIRNALPHVLRPNQRRFRVWSAACATGEEPYSIAGHLADHYPPQEGWDWEILASDISTKALAAGSAGIYPLDRVQSLPPNWLRQYFQRGQGRYEGHVRVKSWLRDRIRFEQINLLGEYRFDQPFEAIFCRNVMIYFDRTTQEELVRRLARFLAPNGCLLTGHSESLTGLATGLSCLQPSVYRKA